MSLSAIPQHYRKAIEKDLKELHKSLKNTNIEYGSFSYLSRSSKMFVYIHPSTTQVKCSAVGIKAWDQLGFISDLPTDIKPPPTPMLDMQPFLKDNKSLSLTRKGDKELAEVCSGRVQADDSGKYHWRVSHSIVDWSESTWVTRLFYCLKEHEKDMGVQVVNIAERGPDWEEWLQTILFSPRLPTCCTVFKGVTDIVMLGKKGFVNIVTLAEDVGSCLVHLTSALVLVEVGVDRPRSQLCERSGLLLPNKLGELISSTYLLGALKAFTEMRPFSSFKAYGLLILRGVLSVGVELQVSVDSIPTVNVLWINSDMDRLESEILFLVNKINMK